jgi:hypothetical protein
MMHLKRFAISMFVVALAFAAGVGTATSAFAQPANDDPGGAVAITAVPSTITQNTSDATTSADETALNAFCGAPTLAQGVWYQFTPTVSEDVAADVTGSDYSAGILVLTGSPGNFTPTGLCGPGRVSGPATAGQTYYLLIFGDGGTTATSGNLVLNVSQAIPAPTITLTVDPRGTVDKTGSANISGTVTCTSTDGSGTLVDVFGSLRQTVGRIFVDGFFDEFVFSSCDGTPVNWTAFVFGSNGKFAGGKAATVAIGFGCTDSCSEGFAQATIQLSKAHVH